MANYLRPRRGKKSTAQTQNFILKSGEIFFEVPDTGIGTGKGRIKMGDGSTAYSNLPYFLNPEESTVNVGGTPIYFTESTSMQTNDYLISEIKSGATLNNMISPIKRVLSDINTRITQQEVQNYNDSLKIKEHTTSLTNMTTNLNNLSTSLTKTTTNLNNLSTKYGQEVGVTQTNGVTNIDVPYVTGLYEYKEIKGGTLLSALNTYTNETTSRLIDHNFRIESLFEKAESNKKSIDNLASSDAETFNYLNELVFDLTLRVQKLETKI